MQQKYLLNLCALEKKRYSVLTQVAELTTQLAEAVDRQDQVSVRMLLSMRQEPVYLLQEIAANESLAQVGLPEEAAHRAAALLQGQQPLTPEEEPLARQAALNRRLLEKLVEIDKRISLKLGAAKSIYAEGTAHSKRA